MTTGSEIATLEPFYTPKLQEKTYRPTSNVPRSVRKWRKRHPNGYRKDRR